MVQEERSIFTFMTKLNFGCGSNFIADFENYDAELDITKPLPFRDNSVDFILAEHVVEHISGPDALRFFDECRRILKPGGVLRVCVPVLNKLTREKAKDIIVNHGHLVPYTADSIDSLVWASGFDSDSIRGPLPLNMKIDGHWRVIGKDQDILETHRLEATKV